MANIVKKGNTTAITKMEPWEEELAARAKDEAASETLGMPRITHRGSVYKMDDKKIPGNKFKGAIVCYGLVKTFYTKGFDPNAPAATPACYAFAEAKPGAEATMVPHAAAPKHESTACQGCPHNAFGTAEKGRGKRCQDKRRVFVIVDPQKEGDLRQMTVRQIEVPPGSLRNWGNFQKEAMEISPLGVRGVLTEFGTEPLEAGAYTLTFNPVEKLDRESVQAIIAIEQKVKPDLFQPFPVLEEKAEEAPKVSEKTAAKVRGKK